MARDGMAWLIAELRARTDAVEGDVTIGAEVYWSDDHLQQRLDATKKKVFWLQLIPLRDELDGSPVYTEYVIPPVVTQWIETAATSGAFTVVDYRGNSVSGYTVDYIGRKITFDADTNGSEYYLKCYFYDMDIAAAQVWLDKAGHRAELFDWKASGTNLKEDAIYKHCMEMYNVYTTKKGAEVRRIARVGYGSQNSF